MNFLNKLILTGILVNLSFPSFAETCEFPAKDKLFSTATVFTDRVNCHYICRYYGCEEPDYSIPGKFVTGQGIWVKDGNQSTCTDSYGDPRSCVFLPG